MRYVYDAAWLLSCQYTFTAKERDAQSGLDYFGARYYGGPLGRFTSPDPGNVGADPENPQSWNAYAYVNNNPLTNIDPDGESCTDPNDTSVACFSDTPRPPANDPVATDPSATLIGLTLQTVTNISQQSQQFVQAIGSWLSQPRNPTCLSASTAAGASVGAGVGMLGLAGGPAVGITEPTAMVIGGGAGYVGGMVSCMSSSGGGGGGSGEGGGSGSGTKISEKIRKQMPKRGWTEKSIDDTISNPHTTREAANKGSSGAATAYFNSDGSYVVRDNITKEILQISERGNAGWIPDSAIVNPFRP